MEVNTDIKGLVFSIDRNVVEDGPGIRTTVFFKGCPLRCVWCHSPQSQSIKKQLQFMINRCIGCGECVKSCPKKAQIVSKTQRYILWDNCDDCGECTKNCPSMALEMAGEWMSADQVMDIVERDAVYYRRSGGGVTFSGGEATLQPDFLFSCLTKCKEAGIHTAVDTCGYAKWSIFENIIPYTDLFLYDLKCMNSGKHEQYTGKNNKLILENLRRIDQNEKTIWIRIPLIHGFTDGEKNVRQIAEFISALKNVERVSLLPYNKAAGAKYTFIGKEYELEHLAVSADKEESLLEIFSPFDMECVIGR